MAFAKLRLARRVVAVACTLMGVLTAFADVRAQQLRAGYVDTPPLIHTLKSGATEGFYVELFAQAARARGLEVRFVRYPNLAALTDALRVGEIGLALPLTQDSAPAGVVLVGPPIASRAVVIGRTGVSTDQVWPQVAMNPLAVVEGGGRPNRPFCGRCRGPRSYRSRRTRTCFWHCLARKWTLRSWANCAGRTTPNAPPCRPCTS